MSLLDTLGHLYDVATNTRTAVDAARAELTADHGPLAALRAFAAMSENAIDDAAVDELYAAVDGVIRTALWTARTAATVAGWLEAHRAEVVTAVDAAIVVAIGIGYHARGWAARLETWRAA